MCIRDRLREVAIQKIDDQTEALVSMIGDNQVDYRFSVSYTHLDVYKRQIQDFADRRLQYGVSQTKLAVMAGISREHLSRSESGKVVVTEEMKVRCV